MQRVIFFIATLLLFLVFSIASVFGQIPSATIIGGKVTGEIKDNVASFKGIPFAAPPIGDLRWRSPQPVQPWQGERPATEFGPACTQSAALIRSAGPKAGLSEDCLYLNVWTAAKTPQEKRPVMVWLYGGAFAAGTSADPRYDGTRLSQMGVVVVSIAHRHGPFGFLAHPELAKQENMGSGNYGLLDIIASLQWIQNNISQFGGDPENVTLFGVSSGALAYSLLASSPEAKGLFHKIIAQSGAYFASARRDNETAQNVLTLDLAEKTGIEFLQKLKVNSIAEARKLPYETIQTALGLGVNVDFWPTVDGKVLVGEPYNLYEAKQFNDVPLLIGSNHNDGAIFSPPGLTPERFKRNIQRSSMSNFAEKLFEVYPHANDQQADAAGRDFFRESRISWAVWAWANLVDTYGKSDVYLYYYDYRTRQSKDGPLHAEEVPYVFRTLPDISSTEPGKNDIDMSKLLSQMWVNFAMTADPNSSGLPKWQPYDRGKNQLLYIGAKSTMRPVPNQEQLNVFDEYFAWRRAQYK